MENERMRITLDNPNKLYIAGQTIKGEIWFNLTKRTKIRGKLRFFITSTLKNLRKF